MTTSYELHHTSPRNGVAKGGWFFARHLSHDRALARVELERARALAEGSEIDVQYRVVRIEREVLSW